MLSYRQKLFIDRTFGAVAIIFLSCITRMAGLVLRRDHSVPREPESVAVAKIVGLGSIVYTGILCRSLKEKFPNTKLIYITGHGSAELVRRMRYADEILVLDDRNAVSMILSACAVIARLWRERVALYFDMEVYSNWAAIIATFSLARNRYGFYRKSAEFKKGMHTHTIFFNAHRHISEIYGQMASSVGARPDASLGGLFNITDEDEKTCLDTLKDMGAGTSSLIVVNPNVSDLLIERRWPAGRWAEYLEAVARSYPDIVFLIAGTSGDLPFTSGIYEALSGDARKNVRNASGEFRLGPFLALIKRSLLLVTSDSGPLHFAASIGKPTVSIWGPGDPAHYAPLSGVNKVIYRSVYCSPCLYHADTTPCHGDNICVKDIQAATVLEATRETLKLIPR